MRRGKEIDMCSNLPKKFILTHTFVTTASIYQIYLVQSELKLLNIENIFISCPSIEVLTIDFRGYLTETLKLAAQHLDKLKILKACEASLTERVDLRMIETLTIETHCRSTRKK